MDRFIDFCSSFCTKMGENLKSNMDRFIVFPKWALVMLKII